MQKVFMIGMLAAVCGFTYTVLKKDRIKKKRFPELWEIDTYSNPEY
jgi:hypothetical protein